MDTSEKLIELIMHSGKVSGFARGLADYLIANGVRLEDKQAISDQTSEWIPVTERLPEPLTQVLSYGHGCFEVNMVDGGVWDNEYYSEYSVTHWMHLPEPPEGGLNDYLYQETKQIHLPTL